MAIDMNMMTLRITGVAHVQTNSCVFVPINLQYPERLCWFEITSPPIPSISVGDTNMNKCECDFYILYCRYTDILCCDKYVYIICICMNQYL